LAHLLVLMWCRSSSPAVSSVGGVGL
jgi:hypothetical protein